MNIFVADQCIVTLLRCAGFFCQISVRRFFFNDVRGTVLETRECRLYCKTLLLAFGKGCLYQTDNFCRKRKELIFSRYFGMEHSAWDSCKSKSHADKNNSNFYTWELQSPQWKLDGLSVLFRYQPNNDRICSGICFELCSISSLVIRCNLTLLTAFKASTTSWSAVRFKNPPIPSAAPLPWPASKNTF